MGVEKGFTAADYYTVKHFEQMQVQSYFWKVTHAEEVIEGFIEECKIRGKNYHVSVGGLDSLLLLPKGKALCRLGKRTQQCAVFRINGIRAWTPRKEPQAQRL